MELETLASIGEFLGGFAILLSLLYLVINLRQNTKQLKENAKTLKREEMRASWEQFDRFRVATLDRDLAQLFLNGLAEKEKLDPVDRHRFGNLMTMMTYSIENSWELTRQGLDEDGSAFERVGQIVANAYSSPGGRRWWERSKMVFKPGFVKSIDEKIGSGSGE